MQKRLDHMHRNVVVVCCLWRMSFDSVAMRNGRRKAQKRRRTCRAHLIRFENGERVAEKPNGPNVVQLRKNARLLAAGGIDAYAIDKAAKS